MDGIGVALTCIDWITTINEEVALLSWTHSLSSILQFAQIKSQWIVSVTRRNPSTSRRPCLMREANIQQGIYGGHGRNLTEILTPFDPSSVSPNETGVNP